MYLSNNNIKNSGSWSSVDEYFENNSSGNDLDFEGGLYIEEPEYTKEKMKAMKKKEEFSDDQSQLL